MTKKHVDDADLLSALTSTTAHLKETQGEIIKLRALLREVSSVIYEHHVAGERFAGIVCPYCTDDFLHRVMDAIGAKTIPPLSEYRNPDEYRKLEP